MYLVTPRQTYQIHFTCEGIVVVVATKDPVYMEGSFFRVLLDPPGYLLRYFGTYLLFSTFGYTIGTAACPTPSMFPALNSGTSAVFARVENHVFVPNTTDLELCSLDILGVEIISPSGQFEFAIYESTTLYGEYRR